MALSRGHLIRHDRLQDASHQTPSILGYSTSTFYTTAISNGASRAEESTALRSAQLSHCISKCQVEYLYAAAGLHKHLA